MGLMAIMACAQVQAGTITGSAHDFSSSAWSGGRICITCHANHNGDSSVTAAPVWNHTMSTATYTLYSSSSLKATLSQPGASSKLCLSCHDGTIAVNSFGGATGTTMVSGSSNLGTNLKKSHPIGFTYDAALVATQGALNDPDTKTLTIGSGSETKTGTIKALLLDGGKMECNSCHDVHNTYTYGSSGLVKQDPTKMCLTCHKM